jgi:hypothetical protein
MWGAAEVLYERDQLDAAHTQATQAVALSRQLAYTQPSATGLGLLARIRQAQGDPAGALEAIGQAQRVELSPQVVALLNPVPVWRVRLLLARGEVAEAERWAEERGLGAKDEPSYPREGEYLVLARLLLGQQQPDQALGLLERLHAQAIAQGRTGSVIEVAALQSLALAARLATAQHIGEVAAPAMVPPLYLDRLVRAFQPGRRTAAPVATQNKPVPAGPAPPPVQRFILLTGAAGPGRPPTPGSARSSWTSPTRPPSTAPTSRSPTRPAATGWRW